MIEYRTEFIEKMVEEKLLPKLNNVVYDFNAELKKLLDDKPIVNVGDYLLDKEGDVYQVQSVKQSELIEEFTFLRDRQNGWKKLLSPIVSTLHLFDYWLSKRLKTGKFSNTPRSYWYYDIIKMRVSDDLEKEFMPINAKYLDILDLAYKVDCIIKQIESGRYETALNKYSKSANIPKRIVEKHPEIIELHQKIETLKSFKHSIQLPL